jgi:hypothetical protein
LTWTRKENKLPQNLNFKEEWLLYVRLLITFTSLHFPHTIYLCDFPSLLTAKSAHFPEEQQSIRAMEIRYEFCEEETKFCNII